jgi:hypothetical protein
MISLFFNGTGKNIWSFSLENKGLWIPFRKAIDFAMPIGIN